MKSVMKRADAMRDYLSAIRRELHRRPELALREYETACVIERELDKAGVAYQRIGETGVLGVVRGRGEGGTIALRTDIDALPIQEETGASYRSETDGVMHACGHDAHTACLIGAAKILAERKDAFCGEARRMFQPAEETGGGAADFIESGALDGVQRAFGLHVAPDLPMGAVGITPGLNNAAVEHFCSYGLRRLKVAKTGEIGAFGKHYICKIVTNRLQFLHSLQGSLRSYWFGGCYEKSEAVAIAGCSGSADRARPRRRTL